MSDDNELKVTITTTREDVADRLRQLAEQIRAGEVTLAGGTVAVPDEVRFEVESEDGELEFELKWGDDNEDEDERQPAAAGPSLVGYIMRGVVTALVTGLVVAAAKHFLPERQDKAAGSDSE